MRFTYLFLVLALVGCEKQAGQVVKPEAASGSGIIQGDVKFVGKPPVMADIPNAICANVHEAIKDESIVVGNDGGLKNCLVYLKGISAGSGKSEPAAVLDQMHCQYVPHVMAMMVGQTLTIRSSDNTPHNVNLQTQVNPPKNYAFVKAGQECQTSFQYPEIFHVSCDVHPWMSAWIGVFSSPYFAVTDAHGHFEIKNIPAGKYELVVWQERLGQQDATITIKNHQTLDHNFSYAPSVSNFGG